VSFKHWPSFSGRCFLFAEQSGRVKCKPDRKIGEPSPACSHTGQFDSKCCTCLCLYPFSFRYCELYSRRGFPYKKRLVVYPRQVKIIKLIFCIRCRNAVVKKKGLLGEIGAYVYRGVWQEIKASEKARRISSWWWYFMAIRPATTLK
jgi:hypothetical protein